jgi:molecular chaperone GrpE
MNETNTNPEVDAPETEPQAQRAAEQATEAVTEEQAANEEDSSESESMEAPATDWEDRYLRLYAEFDNYRKRTNRERLAMIESAGQGVLESLLPVVDDFERGLNVETEDIEVIREGQQLVYTKLVQILQHQGLKALEVNVGDDFDTDRCEAVTNIPHPELKGKVVDVIEKGYELKGRVVRFAKVVVGA